MTAAQHTGTIRPKSAGERGRRAGSCHAASAHLDAAQKDAAFAARPSAKRAGRVWTKEQKGRGRQSIQRIGKLQELQARLQEAVRRLI